MEDWSSFITPRHTATLNVLWSFPLSEMEDRLPPDVCFTCDAPLTCWGAPPKGDGTCTANYECGSQWDGEDFCWTEVFPCNQEYLFNQALRTGKLGLTESWSYYDPDLAWQHRTCESCEFRVRISCRRMPPTGHGHMASYPRIAVATLGGGSPAFYYQDACAMWKERSKEEQGAAVTPPVTQTAYLKPDSSGK